MSWSASVGVQRTNIKEVCDVVDMVKIPYEVNEESLVQLAAAKDAVKSILMDGALGKGPYFQISMGGHANPNHEPQSGWADDCVNISIYQRQSNPS